ncbi:MAG: dihydrofolate reductase [Pseudomonadota bacterium]
MAVPSKSAEPIVSLIATVDENGSIEARDANFWRRTGSAERLDALTRNRAIVLGRRTYASLSFLSPDRWFFVLTRDPDLLEEGGARYLSGYGFWFMPDLGAGIEAARHIAQRVSAPELFVLGGAGVLAEAYPAAQRVYRTLARGQRSCTERLAGLGDGGWRSVHAERSVRNADGSEHQFAVLERLP